MLTDKSKLVADKWVQAHFLYLLYAVVFSIDVTDDIYNFLISVILNSEKITLDVSASWNILCFTEVILRAENGF